MTLLYTDPLFLQHDTGPHPETADRLRAVTARLTKTDLPSRCRTGSYRPLTAETVSQIHSPRMVRSVEDIATHGGGRLDPDTVVSPASFAVALAAAGACASAVDAVLRGDDSNALCLVRPPGHHATPTRSMGFCLFNNIALAAQHALTAHSLDRVLIVDWDVHHGNGTQDIFYDDPRVLFFSIHRYGMGFYPGTGDADETGEGKGLGYTRQRAHPLRHVAQGLPRPPFATLWRKRPTRSSRSWCWSAPASTPMPTTPSARSAWKSRISSG